MKNWKEENELVVVLIPYFDFALLIFSDFREEWTVVMVERWHHQLRRAHLHRWNGNSLRSSAKERQGKKCRKVKEIIDFTEWGNNLFALGLDLVVRVLVFLNLICFWIVQLLDLVEIIGYWLGEWLI